MKQWLYFAFTQLVSLLAMLIGLPLLGVLCYMRGWEAAEQAYVPDWQHEAGLPPKAINRWKSSWINKIWGDDEDGVTGVSWYNDNTMPSRWLAYRWIALRNNANNLRFVFRNKGGPFYRWVSKSGKWYFQAGYYDSGSPVLSAGRV